jgi:5'-methylthioadenosine phosphorylase
MESLSELESRQVQTPFGEPSSPVVLGDLDGKCVAFIARHGAGHRFTPSEVNYRANIYALKSLGATRVVGISACGSLREDYAPGDIVIPDQLVDLTKGRVRSFFGEGLVAHVSVPDPFCPDLSARLVEGVGRAGGKVHRGGAFVTIEGPRFSTRAESGLYRSWGMSIIGMTTSPEAFLAREAEMCYAVMAHVTDYDVWHVSEGPVTVDMVVRVLQANTVLAQQSITRVMAGLEEGRSCTCGRALADALITRRDAIPRETRAKLGLLVDKYLP